MRGERARGPRRKLPPTAICCQLEPQNRYARFNAFHFLPFKGVPAGLRTVSGAVRRLGEKLSSSAELLTGEPHAGWLELRGLAWSWSLSTSTGAGVNPLQRRTAQGPR